jgi:hypothetical protein
LDAGKRAFSFRTAINPFLVRVMLFSRLAGCLFFPSRRLFHWFPC